MREFLQTVNQRSQTARAEKLFKEERIMRLRSERISPAWRMEATRY